MRKYKSIVLRGYKSIALCKYKYIMMRNYKLIAPCKCKYIMLLLSLKILFSICYRQLKDWGDWRTHTNPRTFFFWLAGA
jgi:hypothetical protein